MVPAVDIDLWLVAPLVALAAGSLIPVSIDLFMAPRRALTWWYLTVLGSVALAGWYTWTLRADAVLGASTFYGAYVFDRFTLVFTAMILLVTALGVLLSFTRRESDASGYLSLVLLAALGMAVLAGAGNLMTIFLGLELLSLALYVLVGFPRGDLKAKEAALKYFILGSVASGFLLFGFALIYGAVGSVALSDIFSYVAVFAPSLLFKLGIGLALVGFGFKLALVPLHAWAPDAYEGAPSAITAFMSVGTKAAVFIALGRFLYSAVPVDADRAYLLPLVVLAVFSMLAGSLGALSQQNLKRLLAYSGIAHAGYLVLALPGLTTAGLAAAGFYLAAYAFMNMGAFAVIIRLEQEGPDGAELTAFNGLFYRRPWLAAAMFVFLISLAGLPPTGGFMGKLFLARVAATQGAWMLLAGLILSAGISAFAYLRVVRAMFLAEDREQAGGRRRKVAAVAGAAPSREQQAAAADDVAVAPPVINWSLAAVIVISVLGTLHLGLLPHALLDWLMQGVILP